MKYFLFLMITLVSYSSSTAQVRDDQSFTAKADQASMVRYEKKAEAETGQMNLLLHFTKEQQGSILAINKDYYRQLAKLRDQKLSPVERERLMADIENKRESSFQKNLTAQQYQLCVSKLSAKKASWQRLRDSLATGRRHYSEYNIIKVTPALTQGNKN